MWTDGVAVRAVWVRRRGSRLLVPFDAPALDLGAVIDRGWYTDMGFRGLPPDLGGRREPLMLPNPVAERRYLPTYPLPAWESADGVNWYPRDSRPAIVTANPLSCYL